MAAPSASDAHYPLGAATCFETPLEVRPLASRGRGARGAASASLTPRVRRLAPLRSAQPTHRLSVLVTAVCCLLSVLPFVPQYAKFALRCAPCCARRAATAPHAPSLNSGSAEGVSRLTLAFITFGFWLQLWNLVVLHYNQLQLCFSSADEPSLADGAWVRRPSHRRAYLGRMQRARELPAMRAVVAAQPKAFTRRFPSLRRFRPLIRHY